jgi:cytochrome c-type biogenesis protein CcmF
MKLEFLSLDPESGKIKLNVKEKQNQKNDFIVMKAIIFPWINLLWTGCMLMVVGLTMSIAAGISRKTAVM